MASQNLFSTDFDLKLLDIKSIVAEKNVDFSGAEKYNVNEPVRVILSVL